MLTKSLKSLVYRLAQGNSTARRAVQRYRGWKLARRYAHRAPVCDRSYRLQNVELTNKCPMRCVMCARTNNMTREQGLMTFETFCRVIDEFVRDNPRAAATQDTWLHHFGESLVHPEFGRFIRYAVSKGVRACMSINPIMLTPAIMEELLDSGIHKLYVSLDGHDDESFHKIRGVKNAYEKSRANLLEFLKRKTEKGVQTRIVLSMINFSLNRDSIARQRAYWESIPGIDEYLCKDFITWNGDAEDVNKLADHSVNNAEMRKAYGTPACNVPWETMTVAWDGDVLPCCFDYDKKYKLGSLKEQALAEIWNGPAMRALRREFIDNDVRNPLCRSCQLLYPPPGQAGSGPSAG